MSTFESTGITVDYEPRDGWLAQCAYHLWEGAEGSSEMRAHGRIEYRGFGPDLAGAIDRVLAYTSQLGVVFKEGNGYGPAIDVDGDGEEWHNRHLPSNWRELVSEQSKRLGWESWYEVLPQVENESPRSDADVPHVAR